MNHENIEIDFPTEVNSHHIVSSTSMMENVLNANRRNKSMEFVSRNDSN